MDYLQAVDRLTPDLVSSLRRAVETGRWPDGRALSPEQRRDSLQAVIAWERKHLPEKERVGFIDRGHKTVKDTCSDSGQELPQTLRWSESGQADPT